MKGWTLDDVRALLPEERDVLVDQLELEAQKD